MYTDFMKAFTEASSCEDNISRSFVLLDVLYMWTALSYSNHLYKSGVGGKSVCKPFSPTYSLVHLFII